MSALIDDLALLSDLQTAALVDRRGAVVWASFPRFDSGACFASLLGDDLENGFWRLAPADPDAELTRRYRQGLVLESTWVTDTGTAQVIDFMPVRNEVPDIVRLVVGVEGSVDFEVELSLRFDYGSIIPWVHRAENGDLLAIAGPDRVRLHTEVEHRGENRHTRAEFTVEQGQRVPFVLDWRPSHEPVGPNLDAEMALKRTETFWTDWLSRTTYDGDYVEEVQTSLAVLKGLTYLPTGGLVAAPTTSLPEVLGGQRNWDYRYCWLRDTTYTLLALLESGHVEEAQAWRDWLLRAVAGDPHRVQIMYGLAGERRLTERTIDWLPGHRGSTPVRVGNAAFSQFQLDVFGEVMDALHHARAAGIPTSSDAWNLQRLLMEVVEERWREPDGGIWEVRSERRHFTHSKIMAWVAADRAVKAVENFGLEGPVDRWRELRSEIREEVLAKGVDSRGVFTQTYDSDALDASLLMVPLVGFLPPDDERVVATMEAIMEDLCRDHLVLRYRSEESDDGIDTAREGAFLLCSFWLVQNLALQGRQEDARKWFEQLLELRNDVGLLSEEADWDTGALLGNMPQAFSHVAVVNTAMHLSALSGDAVGRRAETTE